ncbi:MAG: hypothetical protein GY758_16015, partial [Fuerstiella sp.]|nr:hypothetical protein [Fuerstiella sp.]
KAGHVSPLTDSDRRTLVRWIGLGCPIDFDYDPDSPDRRGFGWAADDKRPTLTLTEPRAGVSHTMKRILIGMADYYSGLRLDSLNVTTDFPVNGINAGKNLATQFQNTGNGIFELQLTQPVAAGEYTIQVSVKDQQGNITRVDRVVKITGQSQEQSALRSN